MAYNADETRSAAIVGCSLAQAALSLLNAKGVISNAELDTIFEIVLAGLETSFPHDDEGAQHARKLVETVAHGIQGQRNLPK
jgi:hypothetical protein